MKWAEIWFGKFCEFHNRPGQREWDFTADEIIAFLKNHRDQGTPAWKRLRIIEGLLVFRRFVQQREIDPLLPIRDKMRQIIEVERSRAEGYSTIEESVGKIDPRECDAIQEFRRAMRKAGLALQTERAYVGKVKAFMRDRGLTCLADFERIGASDVESHLTDLAVDGNVAPQTQNAAFHGLLKFFELVLKRDMGRIEAIRATKGKQIPTIMNTDEVSNVLDGLLGVWLVIAKLLYGCGMSISEAVRLRVKDIDFENGLIAIHQSKGGKSRYVPLPADLVEPLRRYVASRKLAFEQDLVRQRHFHRLAQHVVISKAQINYMLCFLVKVALSSSKMGLRRCGCRMRFRKSIRRHIASCVGSTCSPRIACHGIREPEGFIGIMCMKTPSLVTCVARWSVQAS